MNLTFSPNQTDEISYDWVCDGFPDCDNEADEIDCICVENDFQCHAECDSIESEDCGKYLLLPFYCISKAKVEDGQIDCLYGKDE